MTAFNNGLKLAGKSPEIVSPLGSRCGAGDMAPNAEQIYTLGELKDRLVPVFRQYGIREAVLFGSYSKGTATICSDVDILVDSGLHGLRFVGFMESLRTALNGKAIDVLDVSHIEHGSRIENEIMQTGVQLYAE